MVVAAGGWPSLGSVPASEPGRADRHGLGTVYIGQSRTDVPLGGVADQSDDGHAAVAVRFASAVNDANTAPVGRAFPLPVEVPRQLGPAGPARGPTVEVSSDDGKARCGHATIGFGNLTERRQPGASHRRGLLRAG